MDRVRVVLVRPSHAGNVGACARAMKVMGLRRLVLVDPRDPAAAQAPEAIAFASGAADVLAGVQVVATLDEALAGTTLSIGTADTPREFAQPPVDPDEAAALALDELDLPDGEVALVFGTERTGLSIVECQRCTRLASIPTAGEYSSLNLAQAVQIFSWSLRRARLARERAAAGALLGGAGTAASGAAADTSPSGPARGGNAAAAAERARPATHDQLEGFYGHLERALVQIGFLDPASPKRLMPRLRRLFGRARLQVEEVDILRGILNAAAGPRRPDDR